MCTVIDLLQNKPQPILLQKVCFFSKKKKKGEFLAIETQETWNQEKSQLSAGWTFWNIQEQFPTSIYLDPI